MERRHVSDADMLPGYDMLQYGRRFSTPQEIPDADSAELLHYAVYSQLRKMYVSQSETYLLYVVHDGLKESRRPDYLNVAAWAAAEAALVDESKPSLERLKLLESSERCWENALVLQDTVDAMLPEEHVEDDTKLRFALNLAFVPMMKAMVAGNITDSIRERVFADVLAVAQAAGVQRNLAAMNGSIDGFSQLLGFEHECNGHLALLFANDARYVPFPSSARAGSGRQYPEQTHDIVVVNQHFGKIRKAIPVEIKARASLSDIKRYDALVVRGKMHLSVTGCYSPEHTRDAFAAYYEGSATRAQNRTVYQVSSTVKRLLSLYQMGVRQDMPDTPTTYHDLSELRKTRPEFSLRRPEKY